MRLLELYTNALLKWVRPVQELMHEIRKYAPETSETAACIEKSMRIVDAYIKVCVPCHCAYDILASYSYI